MSKYDNRTTEGAERGRFVDMMEGEPPAPLNLMPEAVTYALTFEGDDDSDYETLQERAF
jgi:hypothetical protein